MLSRVFIRALAVVALLALAPAAHAAKGPASVKTAAGDFTRYVSDFVASLPGRDSNAYDAPTASERQTLVDAFLWIEAGDLVRAARLAGSLSYDVVDYSDTATGARLHVLRERTKDGRYPHAWGLYVRRAGSSSRLQIEAPHPLYDVNSELVAVTAFQAGLAAELFIAGSHRYANQDGSSDVAHNAASPFEAVHRAALEPGDRVYQPHGFAESSWPHYGDIVLSSGSATPGALVSELGSAYAALAYATCIYDGTACVGLGGTTNVQGESTRARGGYFVHGEYARWIRDSASERARVGNTAAAILK